MTTPKKAPSRAEIIGWRPLKLTNSRVMRIFELTGCDPLSLEGLQLLRASGIAAQLKLCHALLSPELAVRGIDRDTYCDAFESMDEIKPVYLDTMKVIAAFFQSHAPREMAEAVAKMMTLLNGGTGEKSIDSPLSPELSKLPISALGN